MLHDSFICDMPHSGGAMWVSRSSLHSLVVHEMWGGSLQRVAVCCSVLQCAAACCSQEVDAMRCSVFSVSQCAAVCCSVLQCVAARCSMLQCVAAFGSQHSADSFCTQSCGTPYHNGCVAACNSHGLRAVSRMSSNGANMNSQTCIKNSSLLRVSLFSPCSPPTHLCLCHVHRNDHVR